MLAEGPPAGGAADPETIQKQIEELKRSQRDPLMEEISQRREALSKEADLVDLRALLERAQQTIEAKTTTDGEILEAKKAQDEAAEALPKTIEDRLANHEKLQAMMGEIEALRAKRPQLDTLEHELTRELRDLRQKLDGDPAMAEAKAAVAAADEAVRLLPQQHPKIVAAREAIQAARKALDEKIKTLPEARALAEATARYDDLLKNSPEIVEARKAAEEARKRYQARLEEVLRADPRGAAAVQRLQQIEQEAAEAVKRFRALSEQFPEVRRSVLKEDPVIVKAQKASEEAQKAYRHTVTERTVEERKAIESARIAMSKRVQEKMAGDIMVQDRLERLKKIEDQIRQLQQQVKGGRGHSGRG